MDELLDELEEALAKRLAWRLTDDSYMKKEYWKGYVKALRDFGAKLEKYVDSRIETALISERERGMGPPAT